MRFKKGNKIPYGQDHYFTKGIPHNVDFVVENFSKELVKLTAKGYGAKTPDYGSGSLFVSKKDLEEADVNWKPGNTCGDCHFFELNAAYADFDGGFCYSLPKIQKRNIKHKACIYFKSNKK